MKRAWTGEPKHIQIPTLRILTANDIYKPERFAALSTLAQECLGPRVTKLVLPGDLLGGSVFAERSTGEAVVDVLNILPLSYCTLGNHEFDYGAPRTRELMDKSKFRWLGSNVRQAHSEQREIFHTTTDFDVFEVPLVEGGEVATVGVFGLCTPSTPLLSSPGDEVVFEAPILHARRCVAALKERGCELIIALTHLSLAQDKEVAEGCHDIHAIIGGHDHDPYFLIHQGTFIVKCGQNADYMGVLDFVLDRPGPGHPLDVDHSFQLISTRRVPADPLVLAAAEKWRSQAGEQEELCRVEGETLSSRTSELRTKENAFGCLVADAIRWGLKDRGCQLAIINGGFIRHDCTYPPDTVLTAEHIREEMPFPRKPALMRLRGEELKRGLEEMLAPCPAPTGSFPHLSDGFKVSYSLEEPMLSRIISLEVEGAPVDPDKEYLVAINDFYNEKAGDGVSVFTGLPLASEEDRVIAEIVIAYLRTVDVVRGKAPGRLVSKPSVQNGH